ncbi:MAG: YggU family protein [Bacteriovoracaceae bacterium]|nr:YggU family protein [Bacteriovoracaceae bacterium]
MSNNEWFEIQGDNAVLRVNARPASSKNEICGIFDGRLKIKLSSPPVDGKANKELIKYLSKLTNIPKSSFEIIRGFTSKQKDIACPSSAIELISECFA